MSATPTVTLEYELEAVVVEPAPTACAFCRAADAPRLCCLEHRLPMCEPCRAARGSHLHRSPEEMGGA